MKLDIMNGVILCILQKEIKYVSFCSITKLFHLQFLFYSFKSKNLNNTKYKRL